MEKPKINLQQFARGASSLTPVARISEQMSLRNLPSVQDVGTEQQVNTFLSMADDSKRLQAMSGQQFERELNAVKATQKLEEESRYSDFVLEVQKEVEQARLDAPSVDEIGEYSKQAYDRVYNRFYGEGVGRSSFQSEYIQPKLDHTELKIGQSTFDYQMRLRQVEAERQAESMLQADLIVVQKDPSLLQGMLEDSSRKISETIGAVTDAETERAAIESHKRNLIKAELLGIMDRPGGHIAVLEKLNSDFYKENMDANTYAAIKKDAKRVRDSIIQKQQKEKLSLQERTTNVYFKQIENGKLPDVGIPELGLEPGALPTYTQLDELYKSNTIDKSIYDKGYSSLNKYHDVDNGVLAKQSKGALALSTGALAIGETKDNLDAFLSSVKDEGDVGKWFQTEITAFQKNNYVSTDFRDLVDNVFKGNDPRRMIEVGKVVTEMEQLNPGAIFPWGESKHKFIKDRLDDLRANNITEESTPQEIQDYWRMKQSFPQAQQATSKLVREEMKTFFGNDKQYADALKSHITDQAWGRTDVSDLIKQGKADHILTRQGSTFVDDVTRVRMMYPDLSLEKAIETVMDDNSKRITMNPLNQNEVLEYGPIPSGNIEAEDAIISVDRAVSSFMDSINVPSEWMGISDQGVLKEAYEKGKLVYHLQPNARAGEVWKNTNGITGEYVLSVHPYNRPDLRYTISEDFRLFKDGDISSFMEEKAQIKRKADASEKIYYNYLDKVGEIKLQPKGSLKHLIDTGKLYDLHQKEGDAILDELVAESEMMRDLENDKFWAEMMKTVAGALAGEVEPLFMDLF